jgi:hypothetical protein
MDAKERRHASMGQYNNRVIPQDVSIFQGSLLTVANRLDLGELCRHDSGRY